MIRVPGLGSVLPKVSLRFAAKHRLQYALTFVGIALGVAMVVAVDVANHSARRALELTLDTITGPATHQIVAGTAGVPESIYTRLRTELGIRECVPVITTSVYVKAQEFTLLGTDLLAENTLQRFATGEHGETLTAVSAIEPGVIIPRRVAADMGLEPGSELTVDVSGQQHQIKILAIFDGASSAGMDSLLLTDIAIAQQLLGSYGVITRIDLVLQPDKVEDLRAWLPASVMLVESEAKNEQLLEMSAAFHINLTAMSLLALLVACLLIYNTLTLSVLQRRRTIGIVRSLGATRREIFGLVLLETAVLGSFASIVGVLAGLGLGQVLVRLITRTINDLYFRLQVNELMIDPAMLVKGFLLGLVASLLSALIPAYEATHYAPVSIQNRSSLESSSKRNAVRMTVVGLLMGAVGLLLTSRQEGDLIEGFLALTLIVLGACLLVPLLMLVFVGIMHWLVSRWSGSLTGLLLRGVTAGLSRTGVAVAALTVALSVTVGVAVMIESFRFTVIEWLEQTLSGDIYVVSSRRGGGAIGDEIVAGLEALEGVSGLDRAQWAEVEADVGAVRLMAISMTSGRFERPMVDQVTDVYDRVAAGEGILISEPLAWRSGKGVGDQLVLQLPDSAATYTVLGIYNDYTSSRGLIITSLALYQRDWGDTSLAGVTLYLEEFRDLDLMLLRVRDYLVEAGQTFRVSSNREIKETTLVVFDRTFAITRVLQTLALIVAFIGVLSALLSIQLERQREFAIMRATGMTPAEVGRLVLGQTGVMGLLAGLFAIPLGLLMADVLIHVINRRSFGWSMQQILPFDVLIEAVLLGVVAALLAGIYPAFKAASVPPAQALYEE